MNLDFQNLMRILGDLRHVKEKNALIKFLKTHKLNLIKHFKNELEKAFLIGKTEIILRWKKAIMGLQLEGKILLICRIDITI